MAQAHQAGPLEAHRVAPQAGLQAAHPVALRGGRQEVGVHRVALVVLAEVRGDQEARSSDREQIPSRQSRAVHMQLRSDHSHIRVW